MKTILCLVLVMFTLFFFSGCNHSTDTELINRSKPTNEEAILILARFREIFMSIIRPTFEFLGENTGPTFTKETDFISVIVYFRDTDFSEEIDEMANLFSQIPELESGEPKEYSIARVNMRDALYIGEYLYELGSRYIGKEIEELSQEDIVVILQLFHYRDFDRMVEENEKELEENQK